MKYRSIETIQWWTDEEIPLVVLLVLSYLAFVLLLGPAFMKNRPAYKLSTTLIIYNAAQVFISAWLVKLSLREIMETGLLPKKCYMNIEDHWNLVYIGNRLYFYAKVSELLDTVFFVLRKKTNQVSFLHVYHHTGMVSCYLIFKYHPSHVTSMVRLVNSAIHVVMYGYYSLAALGPNVAKYLTWKKYITSLQMMQFIFCIVYSISTDLVSECPFSSGHTLFVITNMVFITILFSNFYKQKYLRKEKCDGTKEYLSPCMHIIQERQKNE